MITGLTGRAAHGRDLIGAMAFIAMLLCASHARAAVLRLTYETSAMPILPGDQFDVYVNIADLGTDEAAGFQAFLKFDAGSMFFVGGTYTTTPFGLAILPVAASGNTIDLASGINTFAGQLPTTGNAVLVHLVFQATAEFCVPSILYRTHAPPTRITDPVGMPVTPLNLRALEPPDCLGDIVPEGGDGVVNLFDLLELLDRWGEPAPSIADFAPDNCDGVVNLFDLLYMLDHWGACN